MLQRNQARSIGATALASVVAIGLALIVSAPAEASRSMLANAQSWSYQLNGWDRAIASSADVVIVDINAAGSLARLKQKPNGARRAAIAYISIGEAENDRPYWKSCCVGPNRASWITNRTQGWAGNYIVHYWEPGWKAIVRDMVTKALNAGFDGLYLDRVDTYYSVKAPGGSRQEMIKFVKEVVAHARSIKPDVAILVQNAEELLTDPGYVAVIDGIAKESLYYGVPGIGRRNSQNDITHSLGLLKRFKSQGKAVLVVEYLSGNVTGTVGAEIRKHGFVPNFANQKL